MTDNAQTLHWHVSGHVQKLSETLLIFIKGDESYWTSAFYMIIFINSGAANRRGLDGVGV